MQVPWFWRPWLRRLLVCFWLFDSCIPLCSVSVFQCQFWQHCPALIPFGAYEHVRAICLLSDFTLGLISGASLRKHLLDEHSHTPIRSTVLCCCCCCCCFRWILNSVQTHDTKGITACVCVCFWFISITTGVSHKKAPRRCCACCWPTRMDP